MYALITTEEYKKSIYTDLENDKLKTDNRELAKEVEKLKEDLKELLLLLTEGKTNFNGGYEHKIQGYNIVTDSTIADYLNENYIKDGILKFEKTEKSENEGVVESEVEE